MTVKCQMCNPKFVGESEKGKRKHHGYVILLGSIK